MFRFWYRFVGTNFSMITAGHGEQIFERVVSDRIPDFMGQVYEGICREWLLRQLGQNLSPVFFQQIGRWWGSNPNTKTQEERAFRVSGEIHLYFFQKRIYGRVSCRSEKTAECALGFF